MDKPEIPVSMMGGLSDADLQDLVRLHMMKLEKNGDTKSPEELTKELNYLKHYVATQQMFWECGTTLLDLAAIREG